MTVIGVRIEKYTTRRYGASSTVVNHAWQLLKVLLVIIIRTICPGPAATQLAIDRFAHWLQALCIADLCEQCLMP